MKSCGHCEKSFRPIQPHQAYCSQTCKARARERRKRVARRSRQVVERLAVVNASPPPVAIECRACSEPFFPTHGTHIFCDPKCRRMYSIYPEQKALHRCEMCGLESLVSRRRPRCVLGCLPEQARPAYLDARPVYFIQAGFHGPIKIGVAHDIEQRMASLQTAHWQKLRLLGTTPGGFALERDLHRKFAEQRLNGEWFDLSPADLPLAA